MSKSAVITEAYEFSSLQADQTQMGTLYDDTLWALADMPILVWKMTASEVATSSIISLIGLAITDGGGATGIPIRVLSWLVQDFECSAMRLRDMEAVNHNWRSKRGNQILTVVQEEVGSQQLQLYPQVSAPTVTLTVIASTYPPSGTVPACYAPYMVHATLVREYNRASNHQDPELAGAHQQMSQFFLMAGSAPPRP